MAQAQTGSTQARAQERAQEREREREREREQAREVEQALRKAVRGGEVEFDTGTRSLYTMDASNYRRVPLGVVAPRDTDDVDAVLAVCREQRVPVVARGAGTSIAGQATGTGVVLDFTRHMDRIEHLDTAGRTALVQPGVILDRLRDAAAPHGLTFGPDPSTHSRCTLGGMIGNNSCGSHSVAWGTTADNVRELEVTGYDGRRMTLAPGGAGVPAGLREDVRALVRQELSRLRTGFPELPRRISGYALDELLPEKGEDWARVFTGSEGTLGVLTRAKVALVPTPGARVLAVLGYGDESAAAEAAAGLLAYGPLTVEGMANDLVSDAARAGLPRGGAWLFVEVGGDDEAHARSLAGELCRAAAADGAADHLLVGPTAAQRALWRIREDASGTATRMADGSEAWPGWEDCAVPPPRLGAYLRDFRALLRRHGLRGLPYGHFGDGCIHVRIDFDLMGEAGIRRFREFSSDLAETVVAHGGSLSGEHGDGQARAELLPKMYGEEMVGLFGRFKDLWDPAGGLNPGMLVRPARIDENLRFEPLPREPVDVEFGYPHDGGDFSAAVRRCVGVAKCRDTEAGSSVMCPSFRATGEEQHSTRGRARLLHEMLAGEVVTDGWRSEEVHEALDLCLSCKGCRSDCPVGVDMATYKAEFMHHHYEGRRRPMAHYSMGRLPLWLRLAAASRTVPLLNAAARVGPLAALAKRLGGIAPERSIPALAPEPFTRWWRRRRRGGSGTGSGSGGASAASGSGGASAGSGTRTVLWPDTFTNYLSPEAGSAAVRVLEDAGLRVSVPDKQVCCGLTYVSTGQLDQARTVMRRTLERIEPALDAGLPVTVLEPPCAAALRTDVPELLSDDPRARRLAESVRTFAQTLAEYAPEWEPPRIGRPVAGQTHCHQHAVIGDAEDRMLREQAGLNGELSKGCCGLAGNFGFEKGHYEVSAACAEDQLLPAVRKAGPGAELLADGYSCRTQLEQLGGYRSRHLAEVLAEGLEQAGGRQPD